MFCSPEIWYFFFPFTAWFTMNTISICPLCGGEKENCPFLFCQDCVDGLDNLVPTYGTPICDVLLDQLCPSFGGTVDDRRYCRDRNEADPCCIGCGDVTHTPNILCQSCRDIFDHSVNSPQVCSPYVGGQPDDDDPMSTDPCCIGCGGVRVAGISLSIPLMPPTSESIARMSKEASLTTMPCPKMVTIPSLSSRLVNGRSPRMPLRRRRINSISTPTGNTNCWKISWRTCMMCSGKSSRGSNPCPMVAIASQVTIHHLQWLLKAQKFKNSHNRLKIWKL